MSIQTHTATARAWLRHPWAIVFAALTYAIVYEWVFWVLFIGTLVLQALGYWFLALTSGVFAISVSAMRVGAVLGKSGATAFLRDRRKRR